MGRRNAEDDVEAPASAPKRKNSEQEAAGLASAAESSTRSSTSGNVRDEVADPPRATSQRVPGEYTSSSEDLAKPKKLALAEASSRVPSVRSLNASSSMNQSSSPSSARKTVLPGAQAVDGIKSEDDPLQENRQSSRVFDVAQSAGPDMNPIAAEVYQPEADISARVEDIENRLRQELLNNIPLPAAVQAEAIVNEAGQKKRRRTFWIVAVVLLLLVIVGIVGAVVGVMNSRNSAPSADSAPTPSATNPLTSASPSVFVSPCTLCVDGSQPDFDNDISRGFTCADLQADLAQLDDSNDLTCLSGQAKGWFSCSCPTLPRRPSTSVCSAVCPVDSRPPAFESQACIDFEIYVELAGLEEQDCGDLLAQTPADCACSMELDQLRVILGTISTEEDLLDTTTPQYKAIAWLANEDPASLDISVTPLIDIQTRYLGTLLWYSLGGENWLNQYNFLSADGICDWNNGTRGLFCSESSNTILTINIEQNNLVGTLPGLEIAAFDTLDTIQLEKNGIRGNIPSTINNLASLRIFSIRENESFGGTIPSSLFELRRLERLWLDRCNLSGSLPSNVGGATGLTSLSFPFTGLTGTIPTSFSLLTALFEVFLTSNSLRGPLPSVRDMLRLQTLVLYENLLTGTIPDHYGQSPTMETLELGRNNLAGSIPDFSGSLSLQDLGLEENRLTGNLERFFNTTPVLLNEVTLNGNQLTGTIPTSIGLYTNLEGLLWLQGNPALNGTLPTELGLLVALVGALDVGSTSISGTIPSELGRLTLLEELDFADCELSGAIPSEFGDMTALKRFDLDTNQLNGTIPSELGDMTALTVLDLNTNELTGTIPTLLGNLQNLEQISFAINLLSGTVPSILATPPNLVLFLVQTNELTGSLDPFCARSIATVRADCADPAEIICGCCELCL